MLPKLNRNAKDNVGAETVKKRPVQHPGQTLECQRNGAVLWCNCCGTEVSSGSTALERHLASQTHKSKLCTFIAADAEKKKKMEFLHANKVRLMVQSRLGGSSDGAEDGANGDGAEGGGGVRVGGMMTVPMDAQAFPFTKLCVVATRPKYNCAVCHRWITTTAI